MSVQNFKNKKMMTDSQRWDHIVTKLDRVVISSSSNLMRIIPVNAG